MDISNIFKAVEKDDSLSLLAWVNQGGDPDSENEYGLTLLHNAMMFDSLFAFETLLLLGASPEKEVKGSSPLNIAIDSEITSSTDQTWPFGLLNGDDLQPNPVFSSRLIYYGADPHKVDSNGDIPAQNAIQRFHNSFTQMIKTCD